ncbi:ABC transporter permease [Anaerococcus sp.]|uniref:ABC transporter permease n=1 Tax=Anaerococcus sp. TaxID=1872515 RepID=UPI002901DD4C|nr:ABC transporter permease [Anaerococcus sp.]MDU2599466.1 ABC transporter permease [Anaerococcus sp.]
MKNLIKKDLYQIKHNKIILISFLSIILMGIFGAESYILDLKSSKDSIGIFDAMVFDSTIIVILATLITSLLLGIEFKNRTINNDIYFGNLRKDIFTSKIITCLIIYNLLIIVFPLAGCIRMIPKLGFTINMAGGIAHIIKIILYSILLNSAMFSVCIFISFLCRDIGKTLSLSAIYILSFSLLMAYGKPEGLFYKVKILNFIPIMEIRYVVYDKLTSINHIMIITSALIIFIFFTSLASRTFNKTELK